MVASSTHADATDPRKPIPVDPRLAHRQLARDASAATAIIRRESRAAASERRDSSICDEIPAVAPAAQVIASPIGSSMKGQNDSYSGAPMAADGTQRAIARPDTHVLTAIMAATRARFTYSAGSPSCVDAVNALTEAALIVDGVPSDDEVALGIAAEALHAGAEASMPRAEVARLLRNRRDAIPTIATRTRRCDEDEAAREFEHDCDMENT